MNVVCTGAGRFVEVQGTAEGAVFDRTTLDQLLDLAVAGLRRADPAAGRSARRDDQAGAGHPQRGQARRTPAAARDRRPRGRGDRARDVEEYPEPPETGATFAENALIKAREAVRYTGLPAVADDSGITVDALNGMPGVLSARWSGRHGDDDANTALLLGQLADVPDERRGAAFVCAAALVTPDGTEQVLERQWRGGVIREKRGTTGSATTRCSCPTGWTVTSAELEPAEKDARSHRGQAFAALVPVIAELLGADGDG